MLPVDEAQHLTRVLRLTAGQEVRVFNGRGAEFAGIVEQAARSGVGIRLGTPVAPAPEARIAITLAHAVLKGDKMDDVVRDAVMMGVTSLLPVVTERSEVTLGTLARAHRRERWERIAVSSTKQCGRAVVPPIAEPIAFAPVVSGVGIGTLPSPALMLVEPGAAAAQPLRELDAPTPPAATVLVGPEGGWTAAELEQARAACRLVSLGGRTLRADVMSVVALAALYTSWREF